MAWTALSETDLREYLSGGELEAFRRATQAPGETDPVAGIISKVTALVRSYILQCPRYTLAAGATLPDCLKDAACALAVVKIMARAGGAVLDQQGERKKASDAAKQLLALVATGKGPNVEVPTALEGTGAEVAPPGIVEPQYEPPVDTSGNDLELEFDRESQDGA